LSLGAYHLNFRLTSGGRRSVVRLSRTSQWGLSSHEQLAREFATLRDVESSGVTPCALDLVPGDPPMLIETYIDGQPFLYGLRLRDAARAIAAVHRSLPRHALPHLPMAPPQRFLVEDGLRWVARAEAQGFTPVTVRLLLRAAESLCEATAMSADPLVIVHTDLIGTNLLVTDTGCAILDWEGARLGPAAWDLAYFLSPVTLRWASAGAGQLSVGEKQAFLTAYARAADVDPDALRASVVALLPWVVFRALAWCAGFQATADLTVAVRERLSTFTDPDVVQRLLAVADLSLD
ncbi:MAG: aminoglycoside phosphotransferase family protein, partial [Solirubrobacteraceae bacterium]